MSVETTHKEYTQATGFWKRCRDVAEGEDAVKAAGVMYLPKLSGMKPAQYDAYKTRAMFYGGTSRTIQGLTGMALSTAPDPKLPGALAPHVKDVSLAGEPYDAVVGTVLDQVLTVGRYGLLLDFSESSQRPYWVPFLAEDIRNWDVTVRSGDATLTFLVLRECTETRAGFEVSSGERYRVLELVDRNSRLECDVTVWERSGTDKQFTQGKTVTPTRKGVPLDFIPFVCFGPKVPTIRVDKPPLLPLVNVNLSHYRSSADLEHGRHFTALPTPVVTGSKPQTLKIGSSEAWVLPETGADAKFLEFTGKGLETLRDALRDKEQLMQILGARLLEPQKTAQEAHATVRMRHAGDVSVLQTIVSGINLGLTTLWQWHAWWHGATDNQHDEAVDGGLSQSLTPQPDVNLNDLLLAKEAGQISYLTYYANLERAGQTRTGVTAEQEREQIIAEGGVDPLVGAKPKPSEEGAAA